MRYVSAKSAACALAVAVALGGSAALAGPFSPFSGSWNGKGRIFDVNGKSEALSCKSSNTPSADGIAMKLSLVCASDSYRVDFHSDFYTDGHALHGTWTETTRNASGNINGNIGADTINVVADQPGFSATIAVHVVGGNKLDVTLNAHGTSINRVEVTMKR